MDGSIISKTGTTYVVTFLTMKVVQQMLGVFERYKNNYERSLKIMIFEIYTTPTRPY